MTKRLTGLLFAICCLSLTVFAQTTEQSKPVPTPKPKPKVEHFSTVASLPRSPTRTAWVDIRINRYTSDGTTKRMAAVLVEGGQDALVKELEKSKSVGHASLSARVGSFDLKLVRSRKTPTGRRIIGVSDSPIGFLEAYGGGRTMDYKLGIVVLDLTRNKKGKESGEGMLLYASQVKIENGKLEIEYVGMDP
ncbi:MAG TPA: hypothetical protein VE977_17000, partial [Pyrinomonadaceae bacterium]|nr:hypothetical protein [Pyrinomonadaceae bacterium]